MMMPTVGRPTDSDLTARREKRAEKLKQKVPMPPPRLAVATAFPERPDMGHNTRQWVESVKSLVDSAGGVVASSQAVREVQKSTQREQLTVVLKCANNTEDEARRRVDTLSREIKAVKKQHSQVSSELALLLRERKNARDKLRAVEKPLKDLHRRIEYRRKEMPPTESSCDAVTRDLVKGAESLSVAVHGLTVEHGKAERCAVHLDDLARALKLDIDARERLLRDDAVFVDSSTKAIAPATSPRGGAGIHTPRLPPVVQHSPSVAAHAPQHASASSGAERNHPFTVTDPKRIAELSKAAMVDSSAVRAELKKASKAVDDAVNKNLKLVTESTQRTIDDTTALVKILDERLRLLDAEIAEVSRQRDVAIASLHQMAIPLEDNTAKVRQRVASKAKSKTIPEAGLKKDALTQASSREAGTLQVAILTLRNQIAALDQQLERLTATRASLAGARESKARLLAVDQRVLQIGNTPRPPSIASVMTDRHETASQRSGRATPRRAGQ